MAAMAAQLVACQMPNSFSRMAVSVGRCVAWFNSNRGKVVCIGFALSAWFNASPVTRLLAEVGAMIGRSLTPSCRLDDNLELSR
jgi:hypothetical protein